MFPDSLITSMTYTPIDGLGLEKIYEKIAIPEKIMISVVLQ